MRRNKVQQNQINDSTMIGPAVVAIGNPFDGIVLYGPFSIYEEAENFAVSQTGEWNIIRICSPEEATND